MPGLVPGIRVLRAYQQEKTWMAVTSSAKTRFALLPGHDGNEKRVAAMLLRWRYPRVLDDFGPLPGLSVDKSAEMLRGIARQGEALIGELLFD
jgi:hypothetical protein